MRGTTDSLIVAGSDLEAPVGLRVRNHRAKEVSRFTGRDRTGRLVNELILHETVTRSTAATVRVLRKRGLGVHLIIGPDGTITQHGDLAYDRLAHAGGHNGPSVGIEVVNPFYPKYTRANLPWKRVIDAPWVHRGRYLVPTPEQAESTAKLVRLLTGGEVKSLSIAPKWRGLVGTKLAMGRVADGDRRTPGIWAHSYFHHADGAWPVLYAWLRLEAGLPPCFAYEEAIRRATCGRRHVDLTDLAFEWTA